VFFVRILGLGIWLEYCRCLWGLVAIVLLSWLRGKREVCILVGFGVGWHACVGLWRFVGRRYCVGFVQDMVFVSNLGV